MTFLKKLLLGAAARRALPLALIGALTPPSPAPPIFFQRP